MKMAKILYFAAITAIIFTTSTAFAESWEITEGASEDVTTTTSTTEFSWGEQGGTWFLLGVEYCFVPYGEQLNSFSKVVLGVEIPLLYNAYVEASVAGGVWRPDVYKKTSVWLGGFGLNIGYAVTDYFHIQAGGDLYVMDGRYRQDPEIIQGHWGGDLIFLPVASLELAISTSASSFGWNYRNKDLRDHMAPDFYLGLGILYRISLSGDDTAGPE